jgi:hypothetical protein
MEKSKHGRQHNRQSHETATISRNIKLSGCEEKLSLNEAKASIQHWPDQPYNFNYWVKTDLGALKEKVQSLTRLWW